MQLRIDPRGHVRCIYGEALELSQLGSPRIRRGSHVEPTVEGQWTADLSPVGGPTLGPFASRSEALAAEAHWLEEHWLLDDAAEDPGRSLRLAAPPRRLSHANEVPEGTRR